jgi:hypothetical protein
VFHVVHWKWNMIMADSPLCGVHLCDVLRLTYDTERMYHRDELKSRLDYVEMQLGVMVMN